MNPLVVAFEGGLVLGYVLRVGENMLVYEHVLEEEVAAEAETQVASEVEAQVHDEVETELDRQLGDEVEAEVEAQLADLDEQVDDAVESNVPDDE